MFGGIRLDKNRKRVYYGRTKRDKHGLRDWRILRWLTCQAQTGNGINLRKVGRNKKNVE